MIFVFSGIGEKKKMKSKRGREVDFGLSLAACYYFLKCQRDGRAFDKQEWLAEPRMQGQDFKQTLEQVSKAWPIEVGEGGNVTIMIPSGVVMVTTGLGIICGQEEDLAKDDETPMPMRLTQKPRPAPRLFRVQQEALEAADELPPGLLWVWARDTPESTTGSKQFLVASLDDFWEYFRALEPEKRCNYEVVREDRETCFCADLEYYLKEPGNEKIDPTAILNAYKQLVSACVTGVVVEESMWRLCCASSQDKVSFHLFLVSVKFRNFGAHLAFSKSIEAQAPEDVFVMRNGKRELFHDISIYSRNRCMRTLYATKSLEYRPFLCGDDQQLKRALWEDFLVTLPRPHAVMQPFTAVAVAPPRASCDNTLFGKLKEMIEKHFAPEKMVKQLVEDTGVVTFTMINHNCKEICNDIHNNQVYAVANLTKCVYYAKCHANDKGTGPEHPFPQELMALRLVDGKTLSVVNQAMWMFPAASEEASLILRFCAAHFGNSAKVPAPGKADVFYDGSQYSVPLGHCPTDGGQLSLNMSHSGLDIRCVGGTKCSKSGWRLERPSRSAKSHGKWNLQLYFPTEVPLASPSYAYQEEFLKQPNLYLALDFAPNGGGTRELYKARIDIIAKWATQIQENAPQDQRDANGVHVLAAKILHKTEIMRDILLVRQTETAYNEALQIAPDFEYPLRLLPGGAREGPLKVFLALCVHLASRSGFKRVGDDFYVPHTNNQGHCYYEAVPLVHLLTKICGFEKTPNLCSLMWSAKNSGDMERMLRDENIWPTLEPSKRYLGYRNVIYDLEKNETLQWEDAASVMPFNFLDEDFPIDKLEDAKANCPKVTVEKDLIEFGEGNLLDTPLFEGPLRDQGFDRDVIFWLLTFFGRMFHGIGKSQGDNWEILPCCQGAPGTFKSSIITILKSFLQPSQFGVLATTTERSFPIASLYGKLMVFLTEMHGCDLDKELLKQMICGDPVTVSTKYKSATSLPEWNTPMWFAGNGFLAHRDPEGALLRRSAVFPFTFMLPKGHGDVTLVSRIIKSERTLILIKANTLYLAMRTAINKPVHELLPALIREATAQAIMQNDPFHTFIVQRNIFELRARVQWNELWNSYLEWCRTSGNRPYKADPNSPEIQTLLGRLGISFRTHKGNLWLVNVRPRTETDPPFVPIFQARRTTDEDNEPDWSE